MPTKEQHLENVKIYAKIEKLQKQIDIIQKEVLDKKGERDAADYVIVTINGGNGITVPFGVVLNCARKELESLQGFLKYYEKEFAEG